MTPAPAGLHANDSVDPFEPAMLRIMLDYWLVIAEGTALGRVPEEQTRHGFSDVRGAMFVNTSTTWGRSLDGAWGSGTTARTIMAYDIMQARMFMDSATDEVGPAVWRSDGSELESNRLPAAHRGRQSVQHLDHHQHPRGGVLTGRPPGRLAAQDVDYADDLGTPLLFHENWLDSTFSLGAPTNSSFPPRNITQPTRNPHLRRLAEVLSYSTFFAAANTNETPEDPANMELTISGAFLSGDATYGGVREKVD